MKPRGHGTANSTYIIFRRTLIHIYLFFSLYLTLSSSLLFIFPNSFINIVTWIRQGWCMQHISISTDPHSWSNDGRCGSCCCIYIRGGNDLTFKLKISYSLHVFLPVWLVVDGWSVVWLFVDGSLSGCSVVWLVVDGWSVVWSEHMTSLVNLSPC